MFVHAFALALSLLALPGCTDPPEKKEVAISIDDAPVMRFYAHPTQWHRRLVIDSMATALERNGAPATVFAIGSLVESEEGRELLGYWLERGVDLGSHSMTHRSFNELSFEEGRDEIARTNEVLAPFHRIRGALALASVLSYHVVDGEMTAEDSSLCRSRGPVRILHVHMINAIPERADEANVIHALIAQVARIIVEAKFLAPANRLDCFL